MNPHDDKQEERRIAANLQRGIELTELALALRLAVLRQQNSACTMADVMHEIRLQKEAAWQQVGAAEVERAKIEICRSKLCGKQVLDHLDG